jgi:hypothetical protein
VSFRVRLALLCAGALVIALLAAGVAAYLSERSSLTSELDALLRARAGQVTPDVVQLIFGAISCCPSRGDLL